MERLPYQAISFIAPYAGALPALERNELRRLSIECSIHSIYSEALQFLMRDALNQYLERSGAEAPTVKGFPAKIASLGIVSKNLAEQARSYIDRRNDFAHRMATLAAAYSSNDRIWRVSDFSDKFAPTLYGPGREGSELIQSFSEELNKGGHIFTIVWNDHMAIPDVMSFLEAEAERLSRRSDRLLSERLEKISSVNKELAVIKTLLKASPLPDKLILADRPGYLTAGGEQFLRTLFEKCFSDISIAHFFKAKVRWVRKRRKKFEQIR